MWGHVQGKGAHIYYFGQSCPVERQVRFENFGAGVDFGALVIVSAVMWTHTHEPGGVVWNLPEDVGQRSAEVRRYARETEVAC